MAPPSYIFTSLRYDPQLTQIPSRKISHAGWNSSEESPFYQLDLHRDRLLRAARHWRWIKAIEVLAGDDGLRRLSDFLTDSLRPAQTSSPLRVKVTVAEDGALGCESSAVPEVPLENLFPRQLPEPGTEVDVADGLPSRKVAYEVVLDPTRTRRSEYTHFKTSQREVYDAARRRAAIELGQQREVLLVEEDGAVMEGSTTTPYLWRSGRWVTPPVPSRYSSVDGSGGNDGTTRRWALERGIASEEVIHAESIHDGEECWLSNGVRGFMFGRIKLS